MDNNTMLEIMLEKMSKEAERVDEINRRLTSIVKTAIIAFAVSFAVTIISISWLYFRTSYDYPGVMQNNNQNVNVNGGGTNE